MRYAAGPLEVTRPDNRDFLFNIELGQGAKSLVYAAKDLEEAVASMIKEGHQPHAFLLALSDLQKIGKACDWKWEEIARHSTE